MMNHHVHSRRRATKERDVKKRRSYDGPLKGERLRGWGTPKTPKQSLGGRAGKGGLVFGVCEAIGHGIGGRYEAMHAMG